MKRYAILCATGLVVLALAGGMARAQLPDPGMDVEPGATAVVVTDPQNDFLSPEGVTLSLIHI